MKTIRAAAAALCLIVLTSCGGQDATDDASREVNQEAHGGQCLSGGAVTEPASAPAVDDAGAKLPVSFSDAEGNEVTVESTDRILGLDQYGTMTRVLTRLGLGDSIVGRTISSTEPELADLPVVTENGHSLNVESVLSLHPDVVLADDSVKPDGALEQLRSSGVTVVMLDLERSVDSVGADIRTVAHAVGRDAAGEKLAGDVDADIADARREVAEKAPSERPRMAFVLSRGEGVFMFLGEDSGTGSLIEALGGQDIVTESGITARAPATAEAWSALNPDLIVMMTRSLEGMGGIDGLKAKPGVELTTAGKEGRVLTIPDGFALSYGPQTGDIIRAAGEAIYSC